MAISKWIRSDVFRKMMQVASVIRRYFIAGDSRDNRSNKTVAVLKCLLRRFRRRHVPLSNDFCGSKKPCNQTRLQGLNVLVEHIARRSDYADGRGPLETRMVIVAPGAALDGVCPTTLPVATLSSYTQTVLTWKPAFSSVV